MTILVVGASGATGRLVVEQLLNRGERVKVIVRSAEKLAKFLDHVNLKVIKANVLELSDEDIQGYVKDCKAVISCLGHNISLKGIYGHPRRLVTESIRRLCKAIEVCQPKEPVRLILMNTIGNRNRDINEPVSFAQKVIVALLRVMLPPHVDNEKAADYLRIYIGNNNQSIEWAAIRPDTLIDEDKVSDYEVYASPIRSGIFNAGKTSRINVAHFMTELVTDKRLWIKWKGQMPVIYNNDQK